MVGTGDDAHAIANMNAVEESAFAVRDRDSG